MPSPQIGVGEIEIQPSPRPQTPSPSPRVLPGLSFTEIPSLGDMITEGVRIVCQLCRHQHELPREVYSRILLTLQSDRKVISTASSGNDWSDGAMWVRMLEAGESRNCKTTVFKMLEYMGAWEWYDRQVELSQSSVRTGRNKLVSRRSAASYALNKLQSSQTTTTHPIKSIRGVGPLAILEGETISSMDSSPAERVKIAQRNHIRMQLGRGHKLRDKLVKELGFGILFSPRIW